METPFFKCSMKGELLRKASERFPNIDIEAIEAKSMIQAVEKSLNVIIQQPLGERGLSEGKFFVLMYLFMEEMLENEMPGPSDLSDNLGVTRATITGLLDGLERDSMIERRHDTHDRRALSIAMTEKSRALMNEIMPMQALVIERLLSPLSSEEKQTLIRLLGKIDLSLQNPAFM